MLRHAKRRIRSAVRRIAFSDAAELREVARGILGPDEIDTYPHRFDLMATKHNDGFRNEPAFVSAYARAVQASGWDYGVPWRVHQHLWCAAQARKVPGAVVELGTGRGFFMSAVLAGWPEWGQAGRSLHLFDTFESGHLLPDGSRGTSASPFYASSFEDTRRNFEEWPRVHLHRGDLFETLPVVSLGPIAFLHIDLNHAGPETFGLRRLWHQVSPGGVVLLDDYAYAGCEAQYGAMNALAAEFGFAILSTPTGQGIIVK
jgi:hypothetical protein